MLSRDIRLSADELVIARDVMRRRRLELERRLEKTSYAGKPGMKETVLRELAAVRELERSFEHGRAQLARQFARQFAAETQHETEGANLEGWARVARMDAERETESDR